MKFYDTMSRSVQSLPKDDPVTVYSCGPTVYLSPHIGNWRKFVFDDTLMRSLKGHGLTTKHTMNLTDVGHLVGEDWDDSGEDKLEKSAREQRKTAWDVADYYIAEFTAGMQELNLLTPDHVVRATNYIQQQIVLVQQLESAGVTYVIDGDGIYFDTSKIKDYGQLARLDVTKLREGARVKINEHKRNLSDFALWKFSPEGKQRDMEWDSPWGKGFPGWHLECSAIAAATLGKTLTIHTGGIDHIPIHHTNEIAQSETAFNQPLSKLWLHAEFITVDGAKMAKSKGNVYTLDDIKKQGFSALDLRLLFLESHYRTQANFSWEALEAAKNRLERWKSTVEKRYQLAGHVDYDKASQDRQLKDIKSRLANDLDTPKALVALEAFMSYLEQTDLNETAAPLIATHLKEIDNWFGLDFLAIPDIDKQERQLIQGYSTARDKQDFTTSDTLRGQLAQQHQLRISDTAHGPRWHRIR